MAHDYRQPFRVVQQMPAPAHARIGLCLLLGWTLSVATAWANPEGAGPLPYHPSPNAHEGMPHGGSEGPKPGFDHDKPPIGGGVEPPGHPGEPVPGHLPETHTGNHGGKPNDGRPGTDAHDPLNPFPRTGPTPPKPAIVPPRQAPVYADTGQQYKSSMADAERMQGALRAAGATGNSAWETLKRAYNKVMGNPRLPEHFGKPESLPPHLQNLLAKNGNNFINLMRSNLGDLDRELLRATYDKDYYREPLMGYKDYGKFVQSHGEQASYQQLQKLSPADRLQYMMNFGRQTRGEKASAQQLERDLRALQSHDPELAALENVRNQVRQQALVSSIIYDQVMQRSLSELRKSISSQPDIEPYSPGNMAGGEGGGETSPGTPAQGNPNDPKAARDTRHQDALDAVSRQQLIWAATRKANPDLFTRLSTAYDRFVGNIVLPETFNHPESLPEHLRTLLDDSGGYENAMRRDVGDLDRELLRATFDRSYYQEPLMGYASYTKFMAKYGDRATPAQIQMLSPPDRLQYLANHGQQSADEVAAAQERARDYRLAQQRNAQWAKLDALRNELLKQEAINATIYDELVSQVLRDARGVLDSDEDNF